MKKLSIVYEQQKIKNAIEVFGIRKEELVKHKKFTVISEEEIERSFFKFYGISGILYDSL